MSLRDRDIELYDFSIGVTHWRYTDADREALVEGQHYAPAALVRGRLAQSSEEAKNTLELTAPLSLPVLALCRPRPPELRLRVDLKRVRVRDGRVQLAWTGAVSDVEESDRQARLRCISLSAAVETLGLRRSWQSSCPLVLYGQGLGLCNADPDRYAVQAVLSDVAGTRMRSAAFAAFAEGYFDGGCLAWENAWGVERRFIVVHRGDTLTLLTPMVSAPGAAVTVYPGCDRTLGATGCAKFANTANYGGQPTLKGLTSPFGSDPVF